MLLPLLLNNLLGAESPVIPFIPPFGVFLHGATGAATIARTDGALALHNTSGKITS